MPANSDSTLLTKAAEIIRTVPIDANLKLLLIELVVRMDEKRLEELLDLMAVYLEDSEKDEQKLKSALSQIKSKFNREENNLIKETEQQLNVLEGEISEEEKEGKIEEVKKKIKEN